MFDVVAMSMDFNKFDTTWYFDLGAYKDVTIDCNKLHNIEETKDIPNSPQFIHLTRMG
jgi:hypothetical protein